MRLAQQPPAGLKVSLPRVARRDQETAVEEALRTPMTPTVRPDPTPAPGRPHSRHPQGRAVAQCEGRLIRLRCASEHRLNDPYGAHKVRFGAVGTVGDGQFHPRVGPGQR
ncbi:hypothetical protein GCM10022403_095270 [Streptomyces coacervatus]|uniref:Uncharacterized protein n=1 Tax=Streptomyces coacervatus TaxID=647381 RepID=A0ABP7JMX8_9ACTN